MSKPAVTVRSSSRRRRWKVDDARSVLAALAASGLSLDEFARRKGLQRQRLRRWQRRLDREVRPAVAPAAELIEIRPRRAEPVEVVLTSGVILRVGETIDAAELVRLVAALERGC